MNVTVNALQLTRSRRDHWVWDQFLLLIRCTQS